MTLALSRRFAQTYPKLATPEATKWARKMTQIDQTPSPVKKGYRTYVLVLLTLVYAFNFVDRQIIGILSPFIKEDLGLDDAQLGFFKRSGLRDFFIPLWAYPSRGSPTVITG